MTEEDIIKLIRTGGESMNVGVKALYEAMAQHFLRFFVLKGATSEEAKDVLQETMVKIVRSAHGFSGDGSAKSWMWQIARNCLIDHQRKIGTVDSHESIKAARAAVAQSAREAAQRSEDTTFENGVKVTRLPYVGNITKYAEQIADSRPVTVTVSDEHWGHLENTIIDPNVAICNTESLDECVNSGLEVFGRREPERHLAITLQVDGHSIEEIGLRIGRTIAATKEYLSQCRKKLQPYIAHCTELLST